MSSYAYAHCHERWPNDRKRWCDRDGSGGFMGHTCRSFAEVRKERYEERRAELTQQINVLETRLLALDDAHADLAICAHINKTRLGGLLLCSSCGEILGSSDAVSGEPK